MPELAEAATEVKVQPIDVRLPANKVVTLCITTNAAYQQRVWIREKVIAQGKGEANTICREVLYTGNPPQGNADLSLPVFIDHSPEGSDWMASKMHMEFSPGSITIYSADSGPFHTETFGPTWHDCTVRFTWE